MLSGSMKNLIAAGHAALSIFCLLTAVTVTSSSDAATTPAVTVAATVPYAPLDHSSTGVLTFSRTGAVTNDLTVNYMLSGTAEKWTDYYRLPQGDMPVAVTIPAGAASTTLAITAKANTTGANPETAVFTLSADPSYSIGAANTAVITITAAAPVLPSVTVAATVPNAPLDDSSTGVLTFSRTGSSAASLTVNYALSGTAVKWIDYYRLPQGDMPVAVTIPAGAASTTLAITAKANTNGASPETAAFTLSADPSYSLGAFHLPNRSREHSHPHNRGRRVRAGPTPDSDACRVHQSADCERLLPRRQRDGLHGPDHAAGGRPRAARAYPDATGTAPAQHKGARSRDGHQLEPRGREQPVHRAGRVGVHGDRRRPGGCGHGGRLQAPRVLRAAQDLRPENRQRALPAARGARRRRPGRRGHEPGRADLGGDRHLHGHGKSAALQSGDTREPGGLRPLVPEEGHDRLLPWRHGRDARHRIEFQRHRCDHGRGRVPGHAHRAPGRRLRDDPAAVPAGVCRRLQQPRHARRIPNPSRGHGRVAALPDQRRDSDGFRPHLRPGNV